MTDPEFGAHQPVEGWGVLERATELARSGEAFVLATVVWREGPTSGQRGSRAIYTASGEMHGWIGGACAEPVFIREAIATLEAGTPRLLALGASDRFGDLPQGAAAVAMSCQSEGALQIYLEPVVAVPHLVIVGSSPMATTLAALARQLDWRVELVSGSGFSEGLLSAQSILVVATQGHGDEEVLAAGLKAGPAYVGLVASDRRGHSIRARLAEQGFGDDQIETVRVPAGLDLGSTTHKEVAVSILAELVQLRAQGAFAVRIAPRAAARPTAVDPVCGMTVEVDAAAASLELAEGTFYFCCAGCRTSYARQRGVA
ncbi:XdhC family protein [Candidatus Poriferisodalis sp.]|uniref:XdhC family protein n=1 Tax=Candidatus Poriferisodalis sp. TaxID=3101277 RepID=UPI003B02BF2E